MELDHIFICVTENAPEADELINSGLYEGSSNSHKGQGTKNRRFFFNNFYLELLWIDKLEEVLSPKTKEIRLFERFKKINDASPFGIGFRESSKDDTNSIFPYAEYKPDYFPNDMGILVGKDTPINEPMWFLYCPR